MRRVEAPASRILAKFSASLVYLQLHANLQVSNFRCKTMACMGSACSEVLVLTTVNVYRNSCGRVDEAPIDVMGCYGTVNMFCEL